MFDNQEEVRAVSQEFVGDYDNFRPHDALGAYRPGSTVSSKKNESATHKGLLFVSAPPILRSALQEHITDKKDLSNFDVY